jgi:hypothetical protein
MWPEPTEYIRRIEEENLNLKRRISELENKLYEFEINKTDLSYVWYGAAHT